MSDNNDLMRIIEDISELHDTLIAEELEAHAFESDRSHKDYVGVYHGDELLLWELYGDDIFAALREILRRWQLGQSAVRAGYEVALVPAKDNEEEIVSVELMETGVCVGSQPVTGKINKAIEVLLRRHDIPIFSRMTGGGPVGEA